MTTVVTDEVVLSNYRSIAKHQIRRGDEALGRIINDLCDRVENMSTASPQTDQVERDTDAILRSYENGEADAALTIEALVELADKQSAALQAIEIDEGLRGALENAALGFEKHARHWRASAERTSLIEDRLRAENADALAEECRKALSSGEGVGG